MINLPVKDVKDLVLRKITEIIQVFVNSQAILRGEWRFVEITLGGAVTNYKYKHNLPYTPRDVIQVSLVGPGSLTWNYTSFDSENLDITTTGACTVRAFLGSYSEGQ